MYPRTISLLAVLLALSALPLPAQIRGTLQTDGSGVTFTPSIDGPAIAGQRTVEVQCEPDVDCGKVKLVTSGQPNSLWTVAVDGVVARFAEPEGTTAGYIVGSYDGHTFLVNSTTKPLLADRGKSNCAGDSAGLRTLLDRLPKRHPQSAVLFVDSLGHLLRAVDRPFDEGAPLHVYAIRDSGTASAITIRRVSAFRDMETYPIAGDGSAVAIRNNARGFTERAGACQVHQYALLENFKGGAAGQIAINRAVTKPDSSRDTTRLGTVEIAVRRTYRGFLSLGVVRSGLEDPDVRVVGPDSAVVTRDGGDRYLYTLHFTPFYRRRAAEDRSRPLYEYFTPQIGVVVDDIKSNILYGLTAEIPWVGLFVGAGGHTGRVTRIPRGAPLVGETLRGTGRGVDTEEAWRTSHYLSLSLDLRAASTFLSRIAK